jgi:hypothetical protein
MGGVLLGAFVLGACGDGGDIGGAQAENADRADEICLNAQDKVGRELGDDPAADRDAIREAAEQLLAINPPSENENTFELLRQNVNNLWIALDDVAQALDPNVNDRARAERARATVRENNERVMRYGDQYRAEECGRGFGTSGSDERNRN